MKGESLGLEPLLCDLIIGFPIEGEWTPDLPRIQRGMKRKKNESTELSREEEALTNKQE